MFENDNVLLFVNPNVRLFVRDSLTMFDFNTQTRCYGMFTMFDFSIMFYECSYNVLLLRYIIV